MEEGKLVSLFDGLNFKQRFENSGILRLNYFVIQMVELVQIINICTENNLTLFIDTTLRGEYINIVITPKYVEPLEVEKVILEEKDNEQSETF